MSSVLVILLLVFATLCSAQFLYHQPSAALAQYHSSAPATPQQYAHRSVVENSYHESQLPPELSKSNRFYKNPHIAAALAKASWFTDQEMPVIDREAEKIPREMVYKLFKDAGYIKRR